MSEPSDPTKTKPQKSKGTKTLTTEKEPEPVLDDFGDLPDLADLPSPDLPAQATGNNDGERSSLSDFPELLEDSLESSDSTQEEVPSTDFPVDSSKLFSSDFAPSNPDIAPGAVLGGTSENASKNAMETGAELPPPQSASQTMDAIKSYSESLPEAAPVQAALPFTMRIDGKLSPQEAEKLVDVLSRENIGIREVDLEPQFEAGKILLPRISEYAGILLIQALRGIQAKISFKPSDEFADHADEAHQGFAQSFPQDFSVPSEGTLGDHAKFENDAENLPVTHGDDLPQLGVYQVIDTFIVSGILNTREIEASHSAEYTSLTEALIRELKFKASRKGARGITHLQIQLTPMTLPTDFRVTVTGTAVH